MPVDVSPFLHRKGAPKPALVPPEVLSLLECGALSTVNLSEWLAMNQLSLATHLLREWGLDALSQTLAERVHAGAGHTAPARIQAIACFFNGHVATRFGSAFWHAMAVHPSDMARCWAVTMVGAQEDVSLGYLLRLCRPFAADVHFGVRELAWLALRPHISAHLDKSIAILSLWAAHPNKNLRRFASESTRPRGVWCAHIKALKENPALAEPILEPLKDDDALYVQLSVGNWLNDAGKTRPDWVVSTCERWLSVSPVKATRHIVKRGLRNL
jgi:3-methyladenine DNA glycosylase AlkC